MITLVLRQSQYCDASELGPTRISDVCTTSSWGDWAVGDKIPQLEALLHAGSILCDRPTQWASAKPPCISISRFEHHHSISRRNANLITSFGKHRSGRETLTMGKKRVLVSYGVDVDAVAGWLGSYGGEDSSNDISRGNSIPVQVET